MVSPGQKRFFQRRRRTQNASRPKTLGGPRCERCEKPEVLCVCSELKSVKSKFRIVILQHPQEPDKDLGTARLAQLQLPNSTLKVGLSWPNLKKAVDDPGAQPSDWGILYLGSVPVGRATPEPKNWLLPVDKNQKPVPVLSENLSKLKGVIVLDGTWSQAKTLWWRNAWVLKLQRLALSVPHASLYKNLRKEPRRECLSTLESVAYSLSALENDPTIAARLLPAFESLLKKYRELPRNMAQPALEEKQDKKGDGTSAE